MAMRTNKNHRYLRQWSLEYINSLQWCCQKKTEGEIATDGRWSHDSRVSFPYVLRWRLLHLHGRRCDNISYMVFRAVSCSDKRLWRRDIGRTLLEAETNLERQISRANLTCSSMGWEFHSRLHPIYSLSYVTKWIRGWCNRTIRDLWFVYSVVCLVLHSPNKRLSDEVHHYWYTPVLRFKI